MNKSYRRIGAVKTAFELLEYLANQDGLVTGKQVSEALGLPYGTVMSHLATLSDGGYVNQIGEGYRVGTRMSSFWAKIKAELESRRSLIDHALNVLGEV